MLDDNGKTVRLLALMTVPALSVAYCCRGAAPRWLDVIALLSLVATWFLVLGLVASRLARRAASGRTGRGPAATDGALQPHRGSVSTTDDQHTRTPAPHGRPDAPRPLCVLVVAAGWSDVAGGVGTLNRLLCTALARRGVTVFCYVPWTATPAEVEDARRVGVTLVRSLHLPDRTAVDSLSRRPNLPAGIVPDAILAHGRWTGPNASILAGLFHEAVWFPIMHVDSDLVERQQKDGDLHACDRAEQRLTNELRLIREAGRAIVIGPALARRFGRALAALTPAPTMTRIDPGFDRYPEPERRGQARPFRILYLGRLKHPELKGVDLAARAIGDAIGALALPDGEVEFVLRGAQTNKEKDLEAQIGSWAGQHGPRTFIRSYMGDPEVIQTDLRQATLVVMPSRAESFGLAGLEAIAMATPVLVSSRSGLGLLLREKLPKELADRVVIDVTDDEEANVRRWSAAIAGVLRRPEVAAAEAREIRELMASACTWDTAADVVIQAILDARVTD